MEKKMILIDSDEAAKKMTVEGWVSRNGRFYGDNEEIARYDGATHRYCKSCGEIIEKGWVLCSKCREKKATETFLNYPEIDLTEDSVIYSSSSDKYYFNYFIEDIEYDFEEQVEYSSLEDFLNSLKLVACKEEFCREINPEDYYCDIIPEDGDLPLEIEEAFRILNEKIRNCETPVSWFPENKRISIKSILTCLTQKKN